MSELREKAVLALATAKASWTAGKEVPQELVDQFLSMPSTKYQADAVIQAVFEHLMGVGAERLKRALAEVEPAFYAGPVTIEEVMNAPIMFYRAEAVLRLLTKAKDEAGL